MSGGGGSGASYYETSRGKQFDCSTLVERTFLNSPVPAVLASLSVGSVLGVQLQSGGAAPSLVAVDATGAIAGSLTPPRLPQIIDCIQQGFVYVAVIQRINGGQVTVEIRVK